MSARVVVPWIASDDLCPGRDDGPRRAWRVWVDEDGRYRFAGTFAGTEGEAIAAAFEETGSTRGFARAAECETLNQTTLAPTTRVRVGASHRRSH
jgi:hypothetical protein